MRPIPGIRRCSKLLRNSPCAVVLLFLSLWFAPVFCKAESKVSGFEDANRLYEEGKYADAIQRYQELLSTNRVSAAVLFNLGNSWFKSGQLGNAVAAYRRAQRLAPRDPDVRANLQFARNRVQGPKWTPNVWERWLGRATLNEWAVLASSAFWLLFVLLILGHWRPGLKRSLRYFVWIAALGTLGLATCAGMALRVRVSRPTVVITVPSAVVRHGPLEESSTAFTAHDGAELKLLDRKDDWYLVTDGKKNTGWLQKEQFTAF